MGLSYRQALLRPVTVAALLVFSVQTSPLDSVSHGAGHQIRSDFHHSSEDIPAAIGRSWGGASLESEPFLESLGGNLGIGESAPQNEAHRIPTLLSKNIPRILGGSQTVRQPNQFSAWSHFSKPDFIRPKEIPQQLNTPQLSPATSESQNVPPEMSGQGMDRKRDGDNSTLEERLEAGLARVEENTERLVAGFLQLQRSVFTLEQLQELLVLLLEDILKQTGIIDGSHGGGKEFVTDESESEEDKQSSGRKSDADMLSSQETGSEENSGVDGHYSAGHDGRGDHRKGGKIKTETFGKGQLEKNSMRTGQRSNIQDLFFGTEDFGRSQHEHENGVKREGSSPDLEKVKPNEDNREESDGRNEQSDSRDSDEEYDGSEEYDGDSHNFATDPTEPPREPLTASTASDTESQRWLERLVGLTNNARSPDFSRDMLQDRIRARFDNLVQQVAARLSSSLLAAQSNQETGLLSSFGDTSIAFGKDLPTFHLFDPSVTSTEDLTGFSSSELNNVQRQRITESGTTLPHHSLRNELARESPHEPPPLMMLEPLQISADTGDSMNSRSPDTDRYGRDSERTRQTVDVALLRQQINPSSDKLPMWTRSKQSTPVIQETTTHKSKNQKSLLPKVGGVQTSDSFQKQRGVLTGSGLIEGGRKREHQPDTLHLVMAEGTGGVESLWINSEPPRVTPSVKMDELAFIKSLVDATFSPPSTDVETDKAIKDTSFTTVTTVASSELGEAATINKTDNLNAPDESNYNHAIGELLRDLSARLDRHHRDQQRKQQQISEVNNEGFHPDHLSPMAAPGISGRGGNLTSLVLNELDKLIWLSRPGTEEKFKPVFSDPVQETAVWDTAPMMDASESPSSSIASFDKAVTLESIRAKQISNAAAISTKSPAIKMGKKTSSEIVNIDIKNLTLDGEQANKTVEEGIPTTLANLEKVGEWEWLRTFFNGSDFKTSLDWDGLLAGLAEIMQATDVSDDLRSLSDRGSKLVENKRWVMRKSSTESDGDSIMDQGSKWEDSSEENKEIQWVAKNDTKSSNKNLTLHSENMNDITDESMERNVSKESISGNNFIDSAGDRDSYDADEDIDNVDEDNDTEDDDDDDGEEENDSNEDKDSSTAANVNYQRTIPKGWGDDMAFYRMASGEKFTNEENIDQFLAELILHDSSNLQIEDPTSYKHNHIGREHVSELFKKNLESILGQSLIMARDITSHVQSPEVWRRKRRSIRLPNIGDRNLAKKNTIFERPDLKRQKRQTFFGGPDLNPILRPHDRNQVLDISTPSKSFHSQHAINVVRHQDHLLPKTPVDDKTSNADLFNTLMSSILDPPVKNTGVSNSQSNVAGGKASPISPPEAQVSNTLSTDTLNLQSNPYSGIHRQHGHQVSEITHISNTLLAPAGYEASQSLNQILESGLPFSNTNYNKPFSNAQASNSASPQQTKSPFGEQNSVHPSKPKTHFSQQMYNNIPQQYSNTFQNPQISQTPDHSINKNNIHHNMNSFSYNNYNNRASPPYQGFNAYMQTPYRNNPTQRWQSHYPIGGYGHYLNHLGIHFPDVGFIGGPSVLGNPAEPGEMPSFDPEEILANIFKQYWQRVNRMYNPPGPPTTTTIEPGEYEGEITTKQPTTTTTTARTTTTTKTTTTKPMTTPPQSPQSTRKPPTTSTTGETSPLTIDIAKVLLPGTTASPLTRATYTSSNSQTSSLPGAIMITNSASLTTQQDAMFSAPAPATTTTFSPTELQPNRIPATPVRN